MLRWKKNKSSGRRRIKPLLFSDRCKICDEFLVPREFGTGPDTYRLRPGWLSKALAPHPHNPNIAIHRRCAINVEPLPQTRRPAAAVFAWPLG